MHKAQRLEGFHQLPWAKPQNWAFARCEFITALGLHSFATSSATPSASRASRLESLRIEVQRSEKRDCIGSFWGTRILQARVGDTFLTCTPVSVVLCQALLQGRAIVEAATLPGSHGVPACRESLAPKRGKPYIGSQARWRERIHTSSLAYTRPQPCTCKHRYVYSYGSVGV